MCYKCRNLPAYFEVKLYLFGILNLMTQNVMKVEIYEGKEKNGELCADPFTFCGTCKFTIMFSVVGNALLCFICCIFFLSINCITDSLDKTLPVYTSRVE